MAFWTGMPEVATHPTAKQVAYLLQPKEAADHLLHDRFFDKWNECIAYQRTNKNEREGKKLPRIYEHGSMNVLQSRGFFHLSKTLVVTTKARTITSQRIVIPASEVLPDYASFLATITIAPSEIWPSKIADTDGPASLSPCRPPMGWSKQGLSAESFPRIQKGCFYFTTLRSQIFANTSLEIACNKKNYAKDKTDRD